MKNGYEMPLPEMDVHHCNLAVVRCFDFRFREVDQHFAELFFGTKNFDLTGIPAPAKRLQSDQWVFQTLVADVRNVCVSLHRIKTLVILGHWDCGGYGGSEAFDSPEKEEEKYKADLLVAKKLLTAELPGLEIRIFYSKPDNKKLLYLEIK
ncbi:MAG TPA: hypothetical protein P5267_01345 [Patescibacteria group bacterium]|nr:hypothetical protein [Patescibacteria group bacterium]